MNCCNFVCAMNSELCRWKSEYIGSVNYGLLGEEKIVGFIRLGIFLC